MAFALRTLLMASVAAGVGACASNPPVPDRAPVEYRAANPGSAPARSNLPSAPVPPPRVVDVGPSPTSSPAVAEAQALVPEKGTRPGGAMMQPKDSPSARRVQVLGGDTLYDISRRYSVNIRALIETNRLAPPYAIEPGSVVHLPPPNIHVIERGETLYSVSRRYNVDTRSLALLNGLARPWTVWPADELLMPPLARDQARDQGRRVEPAPVPIKTPPAKMSPSVPAKPVRAKPAPTKPPVAVAAVETGAPISLTPSADKPPAAKPPAKAEPASERFTEPPVSAHDFIWPVSGPVLKGFGAGADGQRNDGVNIAVDPGTEVKAAAAGEVVYAGDELVGFGNLVLIRHPGGWISAYAHSEKLLVKEGEAVRQGQPIAASGATGNAPSPQVHFELRKGKEPVDPALHLPPLRG